MESIGKNYYDSTGVCPVCQNKLLPVIIYTGELYSTQVSRKRTSVSTVQKTTTENYKDVKPMYIGFCPDCDEREFRKKEEEDASKKPSPKWVVTGLTLIVLGIALFAVFVILYSAKGMSFNEMGTGSNGLPLFLGILVAFVGLLMIPFNLPDYLAASKKYKKYQTGWREEYKLGTEDDLSSAGAFRMSVSKKNNLRYFSTKDIRYMQKNTWM